MKTKPWIVQTPSRIVWVVRFKTEEAAWRRVVRPAKHNSESEAACRERLSRLGWRVFHEDMNKAAKEAP